MNDLKNESKSPLKERSTWARIFYMILFAIIYSVAELILTIVVIIQTGFKLLTGDTNQRLLEFGRQLSKYVYSIFLFMTFNSEEKPFPFDEWPM